MRENIEWLIEQYTDTIERLERDAQEQSIGLTYIKSQIVAYKTVVGDLQSLLDESEDEE
jgi:hypothetical protein